MTSSTAITDKATISSAMPKPMKASRGAAIFGPASTARIAAVVTTMETIHWKS